MVNMNSILQQVTLNNSLCTKNGDICQGDGGWAKRMITAILLQRRSLCDEIPVVLKMPNEGRLCKDLLFFPVSFLLPPFFHIVSPVLNVSSFSSSFLTNKRIYEEVLSTVHFPAEDVGILHNPVIWASFYAIDARNI